ncbi:MAG: 1-acyl-sn-glycerol-3-phosphate acyltransferase [Planctomycetota bacterium]|jgi:1-acyl-sn-glycerol-3-phosphate acyltransferase
MTALRIAWKLPAISIAFGTSALSMGVENLIGRVLPGGHLRRQNRIVRRWAGWMNRILQIHITVQGPPPPAPFIMVSNHLSYTDVLVLMSQTDARLLSKSEVASWPLLGRLAKIGGTLFINRKMRADIPRVLEEIKATLSLERGIVIFPEGTSSAGLEVMPFKTSLFQVAAAGDFEVVTAAIRYTTGAGDPSAQWSVCWWGDMGFGAHLLGLMRLSRVNAQVTFAEEHLRGSDRKQLAQAAWASVDSMFEPVCSELGEDQSA